MFKSLVILNKSGIPLIRLGDEFVIENDLEGCFLSVVTMLTKEYFNSELNQIMTSKNRILIKRSNNCIGYVVLNGTDKIGISIAIKELSRLLNHIESVFFKDKTIYNPSNEIRTILTQNLSNFVEEVC